MGNTIDNALSLTPNDVSGYPKDYDPFTDPKNRHIVNFKDVKAVRN